MRSTIDVSGRGQRIKLREIDADDLLVVLLKPGPSRTYDDLLVVKRKVMSMHFWDDYKDALSFGRLDTFCRHVTLKNCMIGEEIFGLGVVAVDVFAVYQGAVELRTPSRGVLEEAHGEHRTQMVTDGDLLDVQSLDTSTHSCTAIASTQPTLLLSIDFDKFSALLQAAEEERVEEDDRQDAPAPGGGRRMSTVQGSRRMSTHGGARRRGSASMPRANDPAKIARDFARDPKKASRAIFEKPPSLRTEQEIAAVSRHLRSS
jgi:hypothetical protein